MSELDHTTYMPTTEEILLMFSGGVNHTVVDERYKRQANDNANAAVLMSAVMEQNDREAKRLAGLEKARAARSEKTRKRREERNGVVETEETNNTITGNTVTTPTTADVVTEVS